MDPVIMALYRRAIIQGQALYSRWEDELLMVYPVEHSNLGGAYPLIPISNTPFQRVRRWMK